MQARPEKVPDRRPTTPAEYLSMSEHERERLFAEMRRARDRAALAWLREKWSRLLRRSWRRGAGNR